MKAYITPETDVLDFLTDKAVLLNTSDTSAKQDLGMMSRDEEEDIDADFWE